MSTSLRWRGLVLILLSMSLLSLGEVQVVSGAEGKASAKKSKSKSKKKADPDQPPVNLPADPNEIVLSYDPGLGAADPERKGEAPYLKIRADGSATVTNVADGAQATGQLTEKELQELLAFVVYDQDFLNLTAAMIDEDINKAAASSGSFTDVRGIGTSAIMVKTAEKQNQINYRAATLYQKKHPKAAEIARFAETEKRLIEVAQKIGSRKKSKSK